MSSRTERGVLTTVSALVLAVVALVGASCGGETASGEPVQAAEAAQAPAGPNARTVDYRCARSSGNTIDLEFRNLSELADLVNGINLCEFDGGLEEITVEVPCPNGTQTISVLALEGKVRDQAVIDACNQTN